MLKKIAVLYALTTLSNLAIASDEMFIEDRKILALEACIYDNEKALGRFHPDPNITDVTIWNLSIGRNEGQFSLEGIQALFGYVEKMTGDFHKTDYRAQYKMEEYEGKVTHIFINCYRFHQSPELEEFLKNTPP